MTFDLTSLSSSFNAIAAIATVISTIFLVFANTDYIKRSVRHKARLDIINKLIAINAHIKAFYERATNATKKRGRRKSGLLAVLLLYVIMFTAMIGSVDGIVDLIAVTAIFLIMCYFERKMHVIFKNSAATEENFDTALAAFYNSRELRMYFYMSIFFIVMLVVLPAITPSTFKVSNPWFLVGLIFEVEWDLLNLPIPKGDLESKFFKSLVGDNIPYIKVLDVPGVEGRLESIGSKYLILNKGNKDNVIVEWDDIKTLEILEMPMLKTADAH